MLVSNQVVRVSFFFSFFTTLTLPFLPHHMDFTPIYEFFAPKGELLEPPPSSHPILTDGYDLGPDLIAMIQEQPVTEPTKL